MASLDTALRHAGARLSEAGITQSLLDARLLLMAATGLQMEDLLRWPETELGCDQAAAYEKLIARRMAREPVSRILGRREFWSLEFELSADTLDPRPDSETVIKAICDVIESRHLALRILDIGTGTGCLLLALLSEFPAANGIGIDISPGALRVAGRNAQRLGFDNRAQFRQCDITDTAWVKKLDPGFDIIISNPPYIPGGVIAKLTPEVSQFDPVIALDGGKDGLDFYHSITSSLRYLLNPGGYVALEVGEGQAGSVAQLLQQAGLVTLPPEIDINGIPRAVLARLF